MSHGRNIRETRPPQIAPRHTIYRRLIADPRIYASLALILSLACLYRHLAAAGELPPWFNSDTLWPVNLITDLFVDHYPFAGWQFAIAPYWTPDLLLAGLAYAVTHNAVTATLGAGFLQFLLLVGGCLFCWRSLRLQGEIAAGVLTLLSAAAITLYCAFHPHGGYGAFHQFFLPQTHVGDLVSIAWALGLTLHILQLQKPSAWAMIAFSLVCLLSTMSDMLFAAHFLAPLTAAVTLLALAGRRALTDFLLVILGWTAALAGYICNRFLLNVTGVSAQAAFGWQAVKTASLVFGRGALNFLAAGDYVQIFALAWLAACAIVSLVLLRRFHKTKRQEHALQALFFLIAGGASAGSAAAVILGGSNSLTALHSYGITLRYLHPMFLLPLLTWPVAAGLSRRLASAPHFSLLLPAAAGLLIVCLLLAAAPAATPLAQYTPALVRDLDRYSQATGVKYGYAGYWQARLITLLSHTGLRVYQVDRDLRPQHWVNNLAWYSEAVNHRDRPPQFSFAVLQDPGINLREEDVISVFGGGGRKVSAGGVPVLLYPQETEAAKEQRCPGPVPSLPETWELAGSCLQASTGHAASGVWSAHAPLDVAGQAFLQFAGHLPRGRYMIQIDYSAASAESAVEISYPSGGALLLEPLPAARPRFQAEFVSDSDIESPQVRIFFAGLGSLDVRKISLRRVRAA